VLPANKHGNRRDEEQQADGSDGRAVQDDDGRECQQDRDGHWSVYLPKRNRSGQHTNYPPHSADGLEQIGRKEGVPNGLYRVGGSATLG